MIQVQKQQTQRNNISTFVESGNYNDRDKRTFKNKIREYTGRMDKTTYRASKDSMITVGIIAATTGSWIEFSHIAQNQPTLPAITLLMLGAVGIGCSMIRTAVLGFGHYKGIMQRHTTSEKNKYARVAWNIVHEEPGYKLGEKVSLQDLEIMQSKKFESHIARYRRNLAKATAQAKYEIDNVNEKEAKIQAKLEETEKLRCEITGLV